MVGRDVLDDGKAEPGAAGGPRARLVGAEEPLKDPLLIFAGDPDAPVGDGNLDVLAAAATADGDQRATWLIRDRVGHQVGHRGDQQGLFAQHSKPTRFVGADRDVGVVGRHLVA